MSARRWAAALCAGMLVASVASGCRQILGVEDPVPCDSDTQCALDGEPCVSAECIDGACTYAKIAAGSPAATDVVGDCSTSVCDDQGKATTTVDPDDAPTDDAAGDCKTPACDADGNITTTPAETDVAADTTPGDCEAPGCDADGNPIDVEDLDDCSCEVGVTVECYDGPQGTAGQGPCLKGMATCGADGMLGLCMGQVLPTPDSCLTDAVDEDCTGANNECLGGHQWSWGFGGPTMDFAAPVTALPLGDATATETITVVNFNNEVHIDQELVEGAGRNAAIVKVDAAGVPSVLGSLAVHVSAVRRKGDVIFLGGTLQDGQTETFGGSRTYDPAGDDGFVAAFDPEMQLAWVQTISSASNDPVFGIQVRPGGGVIAYGVVRGVATFDSIGVAPTSYSPVGTTGANYFVAAYESDGALSWVTRWPSAIDTSPIDALSSIAVSPESGDVFVCGYADFSLEVTSDDGDETVLHTNNSLLTDAWVFRLQGADGTTATSNILKIVSPSFDTCLSVGVLPDGGRVISGAVAADVSYIGVTLNQQGTAALMDPFVMTTNLGGTPTQAIMLDFNGAGVAGVTSVDASPDGSIVAGGYFQDGTIDIAGMQYNCPTNRTDGFVVKFGPSLAAQPQWRKHLNKAGTNLMVQSVFAGPDLGVVIGGTMTGAFSAGGAELDFVAQSDVFYAKYDQ